MTVMRVVRVKEVSVSDGCEGEGRGGCGQR